MKRSYTQKQRNEIINCYLSGEDVMSIHKRTGIARSTIYTWIEKQNPSSKVDKALNKGDYNKLKMHCEKLENMIHILKTCGCTVDAPLRQRYEIIKGLSSDYSITTLCDALNVAKGSYYNHIFRNKNDDSLVAKRIKELTPVIEEIFNNSKQTFGAGKIAAIMNDRGYGTTEKTVSKIMHNNGWFSVRSSAKTIYMQNQERRENILNQKFSPEAPNKVWVSDVTYFKLSGKTYYICIILDLYARKIVSHTISKKNSTWLTKTALINAIEERNPDTIMLLFHSDQGYNYTSEKHLRKSLSEYVVFYNDKRPHSFLRYRTPNKAEADFYRYLKQSCNIPIEQK